MVQPVHSSEDLRQIYRARFAGKSAYRQELWAILTQFFSRWIPKDGRILDLGCGYCEFINSVLGDKRYAMDLNPDAHTFANPGVTVLEQDCSISWEVEPSSLDVVFSSNFFEHLPNKAALEQTLGQAYRALKPGGRLIALGPNIRYLPGAYWDFFDHYIPLTHLSLVEVLQKQDFTIRVAWAKFLPYTMSHGPRYPLAFLKLYLAIPWAWRLFGKQFLIVAERPA